MCCQFTPAINEPTIIMSNTGLYAFLSEVSKMGALTNNIGPEQCNKMWHLMISICTVYRYMYSLLRQNVQ